MHNNLLQATCTDAQASSLAILPYEQLSSKRAFEITFLVILINTADLQRSVCGD